MDRETAEELLYEFVGGWESLPPADVVALLDVLSIQHWKHTFRANEHTILIFDYEGVRYVVDVDDVEVEAQEAESWLDSAIVRAEEFVEVNNFQNFWDSSPPMLFHGTPTENVDSILENGLWAENRTRGLANRGVSATTFTSMDPEKAADYGDAVFVIDTEAMRRDGYTPMASGEPGIADYEAMTAVVRAVDMEEDYVVDMPDDSEDYDTVIIHGSIPPKYVKEY